MYDWAQRLTQAGYVALIVDSNTPRGVGNNCQGADSRVTIDDVAGDAAAALAHLRTMPLVRRDRLGLVGFSLGAMVSIRLAGASYQRRRAQGADGLRAIAAFYPGCGTDAFNPPARVRENYEWGSDIVTPLMLFLGAKDDDSPPHHCTQKADRAKSRGQPVSYKTYPDATHSFDNPLWGVAGRQVQSGSRGAFVYRYSPAATEESARDLRSLLDQYLKN